MSLKQISALSVFRVLRSSLCCGLVMWFLFGQQWLMGALAFGLFVLTEAADSSALARQNALQTEIAALRAELAAAQQPGSQAPGQG